MCEYDDAWVARQWPLLVSVGRNAEGRAVRIGPRKIYGPGRWHLTEYLLRILNVRVDMIMHLAIELAGYDDDVCRMFLLHVPTINPQAPGSARIAKRVTETRRFVGLHE